MPKKKSIEEQVEELARVTKRGFDDLESRMATKQDIRLIADSLDLIQQDIHDLKVTMGPLLRTVTALEMELRMHAKRIERLERHAGMAKG